MTCPNLFVVILRYVVPLEAIEQQIVPHRAFLDVHYHAGTLIASGPQVPRSGGVILAKAASRQALEKILHQDPFYIHGLAEYQIYEFSPIKCCPGFEGLFED